MTAAVVCAALFLPACLLCCAAVTAAARLHNERALMRTLGEKQMVLTFDDGPCPESTSAILDALQHCGVRAVFFMTAQRAARHPELVRRMQQEGHAIGLHGLSHRSPWLWGMLPGYARREIKQGTEILRSLGAQPLYFRPAWGRLTPFTALFARREGLKLYFWHVMAEDWLPDATAFSIEQRLRARRGERAVVCLHDAFHRGSGGAALHTAAALRHFIPVSLAQGWQFILPERSACPSAKEAA